MSKISEMFKKLGFTFSFKRLKKAIILVTVFTIIGIVVGVRGGNVIGVWVISCVIGNGIDGGTGADWIL